VEKRFQQDAVAPDCFALQQEIERLHLLQQMALLAATRNITTEYLSELLPELQSALGVDGCGIYRYQPPESPLTLLSSYGIDENLKRELQKIPLRKGLAFQVINDGIPHNWVDLRDEDNLYCAAVLDAGWRSLLILPLITQGRTLGALFLFQRIQRQFSHTEIELLEQICVLTGANIDNYELLEKCQWQHRLTQAGQRELERSRKQLREHLQRLEIANSALEQLSRMKDRFLALASHELRTPLTCILSAGQLLEQQLQAAPPDALALLTTMLQGGERLNLLVDDLLEMARIESRDLYIARESINLENLLQGLIQNRTEAAHRAGINIRRGKIPDLLSPCGDRHHLERALGHLIDNALAAGLRSTPATSAVARYSICKNNWNPSLRNFSVPPSPPIWLTSASLTVAVALRMKIV